MTDTAIEVRLNPDEARALTEEVKLDAGALWTKLLRLYEGGAHTVLGYSSWADYCAAEFSMSDASAYRLLQAGRVLAQLPMGSPVPNERQARELARVEDAGQAGAIWREVTERHGAHVTAEKVREVLDERLPASLATRRARLEKRRGERFGAVQEAPQDGAPADDSGDALELAEAGLRERERAALIDALWRVVHAAEMALKFADEGLEPEIEALLGNAKQLVKAAEKAG